VFVAAFFPQGGQNVVFALYLIGIVVAVLTGFLLRHTLLPGAPVPMILELPPYHLPQLRSVLLHAWQRLQKFLSRAGRLVIPLCVVLGVLNSLSIDGGLLTTEADQDSLLSWLGKLLTPVFAPMGISQDNWPATVGLVSGVLAKEVVVATLNTLYTQVSHAGVVAQVTQFDLWGGLTAAWQSIFSNIRALPSALTNPVLASAAAADMDSRVLGVMYQYFGGSVAAFAYLLFVLLYMPCVSTVVVMVRELDKRWALFSLLWSTGIAYGVAVCFYQLATLQLHPRASLLWAFSVLALFLLTLWGLRRAASAPPAPALLMS
jgi:ferrous iron transport protein B